MTSHHNLPLWIGGSVDAISVTLIYNVKAYFAYLLSRNDWNYQQQTRNENKNQLTGQDYGDPKIHSVVSGFSFQCSRRVRQAVMVPSSNSCLIPPMTSSTMSRGSEEVAFFAPFLTFLFLMRSAIAVMASRLKCVLGVCTR